MKTAISIPDSIFEAAERLAERLGISRSELYQRAVARLLNEHSGDQITQTLNALHADDADSSTLDPALALLQQSALPDEDW